MKFFAVILTVLSLAFAVPHGSYGGVVGSQQGLPQPLVEIAGGIDRPPRSPPSPIIGAPPGLRPRPAPGAQAGVARLTPVAKSPPSPLIGAPIEDRLGQSSSTTTTTMAEATPTLIFGSVDAEAMP
ncbi:hypothetical protein MP638_000508 [Amoeboaphelidium occidentale]|nr:hypothetical protein MP638_000508 [Amoeboaphelidium occidentale]